MLKPRGQSGLEAKHLVSASASASRHSGLGLKVLASASNQNLTPCSMSLFICLLIMCYTPAIIIHFYIEHTHLTYLLMHMF